MGHIYHRSLCLNSTQERSLWWSHSNHRRWQWRSLLPRTIPPNKCIAAILHPQRSKGHIQNHRHPNSSLACFCQTQTYCHTELKYRFLLHKWYNTIINLQSIDLPGVTAPTIQYSIRIIDMPLIQYYSLIKNLLKTLKGIWYITNWARADFLPSCALFGSSLVLICGSGRLSVYREITHNIAHQWGFLW